MYNDILGGWSLAQEKLDRRQTHWEKNPEVVESKKKYNGKVSEVGLRRIKYSVFYIQSF